MKTITSARPVPETQDTDTTFAGVAADRYTSAYRVLWSLFGMLGCASLLQALGFAISKADTIATAASVTATASLVFGLAACLLGMVELHQEQNTPNPRRTR